MPLIVNGTSITDVNVVKDGVTTELNSLYVGDVEVFHKSSRVTDLTNTTWVFNESINNPANFLYSITGSVSGGEYTVTSGNTYKYIDFSIGTAYKVFHMFVSSSGNIPPTNYFHFEMRKSTGAHGWYYYDDNENFRAVSNVRINITGGSSVTDTSLIDWFYDNAELVP